MSERGSERRWVGSEAYDKHRPNGDVESDIEEEKHQADDAEPLSVKGDYGTLVSLRLTQVCACSQRTSMQDIS